MLARLKPAHATSQAVLDLGWEMDEWVGHLFRYLSVHGRTVLHPPVSWTGLYGTRAGKPAPGRASRPG